MTPTPVFPPIDPYSTEFLPVDALHTLYIEQSGNPEGVPALLLHGGPGATPGPSLRQFHDPAIYRIIIIHQRGTGKSTPHACIERNTTPLLIQDLETIRTHLGIQRWHVFGGSWGSTLALAYAEHHADRVISLVLRGIFLCRPEEIQWFYEDSGIVYPDYFAEYESALTPHQRHNRVVAFHGLLNDPDPAIHLPAAKAWSGYEAKCSTLLYNQVGVTYFEDDAVALCMARIENHYFMNSIFLPDNFLLEHAFRLASIPTSIVHGRYDLICPLKNAFDLKAAMPHAHLVIVPDAAHSAFEPGIASALVSFTESMKGLS